MKIRTKLILAFLVLSVLPLAGITLYSYASSLRAFRATVEREAGRMTDEMSDRMTLVTSELDHRIDRLGELPYEVLVAEEDVAEDRKPDADRFVAGLLREMGDSARLVDTLEFVPRAPAVEGDAPAPPVPEREPMVIKLAGLWSAGTNGDAPPDTSVEVLRFGNTSLFVPGAMLEGEDFDVEIAEPVDVGEILEAFGISIDEVWVERAAQVAARGLEAAMEMAQEAEKAAEETRRRAVETTEQLEGSALVTAELDHDVERQQRLLKRVRKLESVSTAPSLQLKGDFGCAVRRGGEVVGDVRAQVDAGRVLLSVLSRTETEQGEIPFAVDSTGQIYATDTDSKRTLQDLGLSEMYNAPETAGPRHPSDNWVVVTRKAPDLGLAFGIARPVGESLGEIRRATGRNLGFGLVMIAVAMLGVVPLSTRMTRGLTTLSDGVDRLAGGDLGARVKIRSRDEIGRLGQAFNHMAGELVAHQRKLVHQERLRKELEMCRQIQDELLPRRSCRLPFADVQALTIPARELGGDFFNYFGLPDGSVALLMGDVSGKGVPAALLMANLQATLRARLPLESNLATLTGLLDAELEASTPSESYLTLFVGVIDPEARRLRFVNAGHNTQYVCRADGSLVGMESTGRPLGLLPGGGYEERTIELGRGDELCLFTDGLTEAENDSGEPFGEERLETLLRQSRAEQPDAVVARIEDALRNHRGRAEAADDATMLVLRLDTV